MATPSASSLDSSKEMERRLVLTTLSGTVAEMMPSMTDLEDHVVDYLASVTDLDVFGCMLDFIPHYASLPRRPNMGNLAK